MTHIIDGKAIAYDLTVELQQQISRVRDEDNLTPCIAIVLVGDDPASAIYVRNKIKAAERVGMEAVLLRISTEIDSKSLLEQIHRLNNDPKISGIIVQLPLPAHLDKNQVILAIDPKKDVDGFHPMNVGCLHSGSNKGFVPCTALGCVHLLKTCHENLKGKNVAIIGRSNIVGKPLSALLLQENCTVTLCHSATAHLSKVTSKADIVISAMGVPRMLTQEYFAPHATVIDVGITRMPYENGIAGDVDFQNVCGKVEHITPVPGGVGPMTVAFLLKNTFGAMLMQNGRH